MSRIGTFLLLAPVAASKYNENAAIEYAKFNGAAYCAQSDIENWDCGEKCSANVKNVKFCQGDTTTAYVGNWDGKCLLTVRGTYNVKACVTDLQMVKTTISWDGCPNCNVHSGFVDEWNSLEACLKSSLKDIGCGAGSSLHLTGHSLGAAVVSLGMISLDAQGWHIAENYNFGMPRTGDETLTKTLDKNFGDRFFRITHHRDPVPQVPYVEFGYEHASPEIFYEGNVTDGFKQCNGAEDSACSYQYSNQIVRNLLNINDHLTYMGTNTSPFHCKNFPIVV